MKRTLIILLMPLIALSCKSKSNPTPDESVVVKYSWSSGSKATYQVEYTGASGTPIDTTYTGTSFVKSITVKQSSGFKIAQFKLLKINPNVPVFTAFRIDGEMTIYRNDYLEALHDVGLEQNSDLTVVQYCTTSIFGQ